MVYLFGDIHGCPDELFNRLEEANVKPGDTVVLLGDVGLNYRIGNNEDSRNKEKMEQTGIYFLCIHGNHERRPSTISTYCPRLWRGGTVFIEEDYPHLLFARDGEIFDLEGSKAIALGGAYSVDKYYRLAVGWSWFPDEQPSDAIKAETECSLDRADWKIDYVFSHTCPAKYIPVETFLPNVDQSAVDRSTENWLDRIENKLTYKAWYCGHWHIDKHIDKMHFLYHTLEQIHQGE